MRIISFILCFTILCNCRTLAKEDNVNTGNVDNLKILRNSVNFAYKAGNEFLNLIRGGKPSHVATTQAFKIFSGKDVFKLMDLLPIFMPFVGYFCLVSIGLLFICLVPIVGMCFCLCRCCGKCGGKVKGMDPKHATCKRYTYALFLGIISIIQLSGIVLAFINNQLVHDTLTNPSTEINAVKQLEDGTQMMRSSLKNITEAIQASEQSPVRGNRVNIDFLNVTCNSYFAVFKNESEKLNINKDLTKILTKLEETLKYLDGLSQDTGTLKAYASGFRTEISNLESADIRSQVCKIISDAVKTEFDDLNSLIQGQVTGGSSTSSKLREIVNFFNATVLPPLADVQTYFTTHVKTEYLEYRMYVCIGVCCLLLLIVLFYFLGLCFGQCGERPFEDARLCNRGVGANLMMAGVAFAFLFTPMIMIFEMSLFMSGGATQTELCRYFVDRTSPGVGALDRVLQTIPNLANNPLVNRSILDSVINRCPTKPMAVAFKLGGRNLMTMEVGKKITDITDKVVGLSDQTKNNLVDGYFKAIEGLLLNISADTGGMAERYVKFDERASGVIRSYVQSLSSEISGFSLNSVKNKLKRSLNLAAVTGFGSSLKSESDNALNGLLLSSYNNVKCDGLSTSAVKIVDSVCVTFLWPFNGFWFGVGICLVFTIPAVILAVKLAGLYRRTEKYSADYEEPDYHSYMGFYTNNADNIPMKRPKSAKSNQKNRNSNSNNKDSLKQNNPQYLPVYPYDAYE